jgi:toxin ParE1/3/4
MVEEAEADLLAIADFLAELSNAAAFRFIDAIQAALGRLSLFPSTGHSHRDLPSAYRVMTVDEWEIVYREESDHVIVVRIVHGRRDLTQLLS